MSNPLPLAGRVTIVTGAGGGIGRQHALAFARLGSAVVVNDFGGAGDGTGSSAAPAEEVAAEIRAMGGQAVAQFGDVSDPKCAQEMVTVAMDEFGDINTLVNNAGILRDRTILNMPVEDFDLVLAVHLRGTFLTTQAVGRFWRDNVKDGKGVDGRIVNTTSGSGLFGNFGQGNYSPAKAGIAALTIVTSLEFAKYGVNANCIAPVAKTRLIGTTGTDVTLKEGYDPFDPQFVSPLVTWLGGPDCSVTGRAFSVVGGYVGVAEPWQIGDSVYNPDGPLTYDMINAQLPAAVANSKPNMSPANSHPYSMRD
ncbi:MAG: SDR family NAD(P)-dependent oxidoreductase [Candidatus Nanopelagicales bacterium]